MSEWFSTDDAPAGTPVLVAHPDWDHADVCLLDDEGLWYTPVNGAEPYPQPTLWQPLPPIPKLS